MPVHDSNEVSLRWLPDTLVGSMRLGADSSTMPQLAVLMILFKARAPRTVRGLAEMLTVSCPAISRVLPRLGEHGLTRLQIDPRDPRSVVMRRPHKSAGRMQHLSGRMWPGPATAGDFRRPLLAIRHGPNTRRKLSNPPLTLTRRLSIALGEQTDK